MLNIPGELEPMFPKGNGPLVDLAMEVLSEAAALRKLLHKITREHIAGLLCHSCTAKAGLVN